MKKIVWFTVLFTLLLSGCGVQKLTEEPTETPSANTPVAEQEQVSPSTESTTGNGSASFYVDSLFAENLMWSRVYALDAIININ